jgi:type IV pilus assembly protein PilV
VIGRRHRANGFSLVEVMVALVVLSVGLLGIAGLYVITLRSGGGAIYRMQAVNLASDMADRIRANRRAQLAYNNAPANNNCYGAAAVADCTPPQMAANDLLVWRAQVTGILPQGQGTVQAAGAAGAPFSYTILVSWMESGSAVAADRMSYTLQFQL